MRYGMIATTWRAVRIGARVVLLGRPIPTRYPLSAMADTHHLSRSAYERYLKLAERVKDPTTRPALQEAVSVEETTAAHSAREAASGKER